MNKLNNAFFFDIDGTLSEGGIIPDSAIMALKMLRANGDLVFLSTGRCLSMLNDVLSKIEVDGAILNNGALAIVNNEIIFESVIDKNIIKNMIDNKLHVALLTKDKYLRINDNDLAFDRFCSYFNIDLPIVVDNLNTDAYSLGVYDLNLNNIDINSYPSLAFVKACRYGYDVFNKGINKSVPLKKFKGLFKGYKFIAFGDNYNDIEILKSVDVSICMKKSPQIVKDAATYQTLDVNEDGIMYALKNIINVL